jgi:hypothetical protein
MGIRRGRRYLGAPGPETILEPRDPRVRQDQPPRQHLKIATGS